MNIISAFLITVLLFLLSQNCRASVEISPFWGQRSGGEVEEIKTGTILRIKGSESRGLVLGYDLNSNQQMEFLYSHQRSALLAGGTFTGERVFGLDVDYYHVGGTYVSDGGAWRPYVAASIGLTRLKPDDARYSDENKLSFGIGGGVKGKLVDVIGWRVEVRGFTVILEGRSAIFCGEDGCIFSMTGDGYWQYELHAGLGIVF